MSTGSSTRSGAGVGGAVRALLPRRHERGVLVWMVLVYTALLGTASLASVVAAVVVVAALRAVFPITTSPEPSRVRPWATVVLVAVVLGEMARAAATVAWLALRPGPGPVTAVVAVGLRTRSEAVAVTTSMIITLLPGSLLVDLDVPTATLYVHALGAGDPAAEAAAQARTVEALVARALGHGLADGPVGTGGHHGPGTAA